MGKLEGKVAFVTGAGSGIGRAIAEAFAQEGARVAVNDNSGARVRTTVNRLRSGGGDAHPVQGDVAVEAALRDMVRSTLREFSRIDILVNNAGVVTFALVEHMSARLWDRTIAVHLRGTFLCTRFVLPHMMRAGGGKIINIASQRGQKGGPSLAHYAAAKAGIIGFTKSLALEVSRRNINVNVIAPGPIRTDAPRTDTQLRCEKRLANHASAAVRRALVMRDTELLKSEHTPPALRHVICGGAAHASQP